MRVDLVKQRGVLEKFVLVALFRDVSEWQLRGGVCAGGFLRSECGVGRGVGFGGERCKQVDMAKQGSVVSGVRVPQRYVTVLLTFLCTCVCYIERVGFSMAYTAAANEAGVGEAVKG